MELKEIRLLNSNDLDDLFDKIRKVMDEKSRSISKNNFKKFKSLVKVGDIIDKDNKSNEKSVISKVTNKKIEYKYTETNIETCSISERDYIPHYFSTIHRNNKLIWKWK